MRPEIPADLAALSLDELNDLLRQLQEFASSAPYATDEEWATLQAAVADGERVQAEITGRDGGDEPGSIAEPTQASTDRAAERDALLNRISSPADGTGDGDGGGDGDASPPSSVDDTVAAAINRYFARAAERLPALRPDQVVTADGAVQLDGLPPLSAIAGRIRSTDVAVIDRPAPIRASHVITAGADVSGFQTGEQLDSLDRIDEALLARVENLWQPARGGTDGEKVIVASIRSTLPEDRTLRAGHDADNRRKLRTLQDEAITAAGGLCAPVTPYYEFMVLAGAQRPVRDALTSFGATRGGITFMPALQWTAAGNQARTVADGATTNTSATVTSATAAFDSRDVGAALSGTGIPANSFIVSVTNATTVVLSAAATATATGVTFTITRLGASRVVTAAQDAAAVAGGSAADLVAGAKPCFHVTCPSPTTVNVNAVTNCIEIGNFFARTYPEAVTGWTRMALATWARTAETALLDRLSALSTQVTAAQPATNMGVSRSLPAQLIKAAAYYRSRNRMDMAATLQVLLPYWVPAMTQVDQLFGSLFDADYYRNQAEIESTLAAANIVVNWYMDSATGKGQLINSGTQQAAAALVAFPGTIVSYLFAPGSFLFLDGGTLDFGLVRDSVLNAANNYRVFSESFEQVAFIGVESLEITHTVVASGVGSAAGTGPVAF